MYARKKFLFFLYLSIASFIGLILIFFLVDPKTNFVFFDISLKVQFIFLFLLFITCFSFFSYLFLNKKRGLLASFFFLLLSLFKTIGINNYFYLILIALILFLIDAFSSKEPPAIKTNRKI